MDATSGAVREDPKSGSERISYSFPWSAASGGPVQILFRYRFEYTESTEEYSAPWIHFKAIRSKLPASDVHMDMHCIRRGTGKPLLLVHGLGGSWRSWNRIIDRLVQSGRTVIAVNLPGHGNTPELTGEVSIRTLADALTQFLAKRDLLGIDAVGSSMGARVVLELARRGGVLGSVVALDPGGFWKGWEVPFFFFSVATSVRLVRCLQPVMPLVTKSSIGRSVLLAQFSERPWALPPHLALNEMRCFATAPSFDKLLEDLAFGESQKGAPSGSIQSPVVIGWGRNDKVCLPQQAERAKSLFPDAHLHWFSNCGHFPQWDAPEETVRLILTATSGKAVETMEPAAVTRVHASTRWATAAAFAVAIAGAAAWLLGLKA